MIRTSKMTSIAFAVFLLAHPVSGGKDKTAKSSENSEQGFMQTLQAAFKSQFASNSAALNFLMGKLTNNINNPTGFTPQTLASMNSSAIQNTALQTKSAQQAAAASSASKGNGLPSGVQAQVAGQIAAAGANQESGELNQIQIANGQQQEQNYWNAISGASQVAGEMNPNGYAGSANGAGGTIAGLSQAYTASNGLQQMGTAFAGGLGQGLGSGLGKGLGGGGWGNSGGGSGSGP